MAEDRDDTLSLLETERGTAEGKLLRRRVSLLLYHREGTTLLHLAVDAPLVVGRAAPADAVLRDIKLSRQHARFLWRVEGVFVEDLGSSNGTFVNGKRIEAPTRLHAGDEVAMGSVRGSVVVLAPRDEGSHTAEGYDRFSQRLEEELFRCAALGRSVALLMVRAAPGAPASHVRHFLPRVKALLRPTDFVGLYSPGHLLVALPERTRAATESLAEAVATSAPEEAPSLLVGFATYPETAGSAEELVSRAHAAALRATPAQSIHGEEGAHEAEALPRVVLASSPMRRLFETAARVARTSASVLIVGETGTGKELVARAIHEGSPRSGSRLSAVSCGAIPRSLVESTLFGHEKGAFTGADRRQKGIFEHASGGTVFLDEVAELAPSAQAALLRVLETGRLMRVGSAEEVEVDVRVVAATHKDLEELAAKGEFREDLLYRLNAITLEVPALRDRVDDVEPLAEQFVAEAAAASDLPVPRIDADAREALRRHSWPGNVRELRNAMERAVAIAEGPSITVEDLPRRVRGEPEGRERAPLPLPDEPDVEFKERVRRFEKDLIVEALERTGGNQSRAAELLRMPRRTLVEKIRVLGIRKK